MPNPRPDECRKLAKPQRLALCDDGPPVGAAPEEGEEIEVKEKLKSRWAQMEALVGS